MGVEGKKGSMLRQLMMKQRGNRTSESLTIEEWGQVVQMDLWICNAIASCIEQQPYVTQNVLSVVMARVMAMTMKLNYDMFGNPDELQHTLYLVTKAWNDIKDKEVDYASNTGNDT